MPTHDVDAAAEGVLLRAHADAAVHREAADRRVDGEIFQIFDNLRRELARRRDDERARRPRTGAGLLHGSRLRIRQQEGRGFSTACLGTGEQVAPGQRRWNRIGLNRRRPLKAEVFHASQQIGVGFNSENDIGP